MDCWVTGRWAAKLICGRGLFDGSLIDFSSDVNSVNKRSRIKHYVYRYTRVLESDKTLQRLRSHAVGVQSYSSQTKRYKDHEVMQ